MVTFGGLATPFVAPPVNLAVIAALALLAGRRRLAVACLALLLLLAVPAVADGLIVTLEWGQAGGDPGLGETTRAQAIVVLGAEVARSADGRTLPGPLSLQRLRAAAALSRRTGLPLLVSGGITRPGTAPVAVAMADSLREDFGVPARWTEDRSADTFENARDSAAILRSAGVETVFVVTDPWHMRRAMAAFRAAGFPAIAAPGPTPGRDGLGWEDLIPRVSAWQRSYFALHEWIGVAWYALRAAM